MAKKYALIIAAGNFQKREQDDLLLLYFSGHGTKNEEGNTLHLALVSTDPDVLDQASIDCSWLRKTMNKSRSKRQLLILDCCYSGAFDEGRAAADTQALLRDSLTPQAEEPFDAR